MKRSFILFPTILISLCFLLGQATSSYNGITGQGKGAPASQGKSPAAPANVFIVNTADDHDDGSCTAGDCTLREAILAANANAGADTINFAIGSGAQTIALNAPLPSISGSVTLDATSQPGYAGVPLIEIFQVQPAPPDIIASDGLSLGATATGSTIRGFILNRFKRDPQFGNGGNGIIVQASNCTIAGNYIGTDAAGNVALANEASGIFVIGAGNITIGGTGANDRNVISGNFDNGILLFGSLASAGHIVGNYIGTNAAGNAILGNTGDGINVNNGASNNTIGGATPAERNLISGNGNGIHFIQTTMTTTGNLVQGNYIGTDATGTLRLGNSIAGVDIFGAVNNTIGGSSAARNVISGNGEGIRINSSTATGNLIQGNTIGTAADGSSPLGNSFFGINIGFSAHDNLIGGTLAGTGNVIAFNGTNGFTSAGLIVNAPARANAILGNSIFQNSGLGIDLSPVGVTPNDTGDGDTGANDLQNFPLITAANTSANGNLHVQGTLNSTANTNFRLEFFSNPTCDESGNGEGKTFLGSTAVTTDGSGNISFNTTLPTAAPAGSQITATATQLNPDSSPASTSEFSPCFTSIGLTDVIVQMTDSPDPVTVGSLVTYQITVSTGAFDGANNVVVTDNLPSQVTFFSCTTSSGVCGGSGNNRTVTFNSIAAGNTATVTLTAQVNCGTANNVIINNMVSATTVTPETTTTNNSASTTTTVNNPGASIMPTSVNVPGSAGSGSVNLTFPAGCSWTAVSNDSWLTIISGASGSGNGLIQYTISQNPGAARTGTLTIAGLTFTVNQDVVIVCDYTLTPNQAMFDANANTGDFTVTTQNSCSWVAKPNEDWITITPPGMGTGNGQVNYSVTQNTTGSPRTGTITVADQTFTIQQSNTVTAVKLITFTATAYDNGVLLEWQTGQEVNNLGFHLYRNDGGARSRITPEIISGSALLAGSGITLRAGGRYAWWDAQGKRASEYWLEDIDLSGAQTLHGTTATSIINGKPPQTRQADYLSRLGKVEARMVAPSTAEQQMRRNAATDVARQHANQELAAKPAIKIAVRETGWYQVTRDELIAAGLPAKVNPNFLQLYADGEEQAISVTGAIDGSFDSGDRIEFYGTGLDTPATDKRIYWLVVGTQPGKRISLSKSDVRAGGASSFLTTIERRDRQIYFAALKNGDKENFFGVVVAGSAVEQAIPLRHLDTSTTEMATVEVTLQGVTAAAHQVQVALNGTTLGTVTFQNQSSGAMKFTVPQTLLREGTNAVLLTPLGGTSDVSLVDSIRISYRHRYTADNDSLQCSIENAKGEAQSIGGFSSPAIRVFDISSPGNVQEFLGNVEAADGAYRITVQTGTAKTLFAFSGDNFKHPVSLTANQPSHWRDSDHSADLLIITPRDFLSSVAPLKALREQQSFRVEIADLEDIYDEFSFGEKEPQAIKDFLATTRTSWKQAPRFVLFVGGASYDPRDYLGAGDFDFTPTKLIDTEYLETASDDWFADFDNDGLPEMSIGRLPVRSATEASAMVAKIVAYDGLREKLSDRRSVLLVADKNEDFNFEQVNTQLKNLLPSGTAVQEIFRGRLDDTEAKRQLLDAITQGQTIVNYTGHGSTGIWRSLLTAEDALAFGNQKNPSFFITMTCLNGYFLNVMDESLAEALLKASGGAIAVWSSSGITDAGEQAVMNQQLYRSLFDKKMTLGEIIRQAKQATQNRDVRRTWLLFGDPTMRLH